MHLMGKRGYFHRFTTPSLIACPEQPYLYSSCSQQHTTFWFLILFLFLVIHLYLYICKYKLSPPPPLPPYLVIVLYHVRTCPHTSLLRFLRTCQNPHQGLVCTPNCQIPSQLTLYLTLSHPHHSNTSSSSFLLLTCHTSLYHHSLMMVAVQSPKHWNIIVTSSIRVN